MNELSRECIECDAENCSNRAVLACRLCNAYYYCCEACREQGIDHPCYNHEEMSAEQMLQEGTYRTDQVAIDSSLNSRCGICLETILIEPVVLTDCHHKFCTPCLVDWKSQLETCPYCRPDDDGDLNKHRAVLIQVLCRRAAIASDDDTKARILNRALHSADELVEAAGRGPKTLLVKLKVQSRIQGSEQTAIEIAEEIHALLEERQREVLMMQCIAYEQALDQHYEVLSRVLTGTQMFQAQVDIILGQIHKSVHKWQEAIEFFNSALQQGNQDDNSDGESNIICRGVYWQLVRCYYEVEDFDRAISTAELALDESRDKLEVHKYMALSHKANGDPYTALKVMHRGVLYTLDNGDRQEAYDLYEELRRELAS